MKVYTTKYALTSGIEILTVKHSQRGDKYVYTNTGLDFQQFILGKTAFLTYQEAAVAARLMRDKKVILLQKQLDKVTGLLFPALEPDHLKT